MLAVNLKCFVVSLMISSILGAKLNGGDPALPKPIYDLDDAESHFENFITLFGKQYSNDEEKNRRFEIFKEQLEDINQRNKDPNQSAVFGITQFCDLTLEEFLKGYTGLKIDPARKVGPYYNLTKIVDVSDEFDWRQHGVVAPVKNQGICGSCWTFGSTGAIESANAIKYGQLKLLSEQQILDCDNKGFGCQGGFMQDAINYVVQAGGQEGEQSYPYETRQDQCRFNPSRTEVRVAQMIPYNLNDERTTIQYLRQNGPITIGVDADEFRTYRGGVLRCTGNRVNHAVLLIGYGQVGGQPYYTIKNSWGTNWGERGFIRVHRQYNCGLYNAEAAGAVIA